MLKYLIDENVDRTYTNQRRRLNLDLEVGFSDLEGCYGMIKSRSVPRGSVNNDF